MPDNAIRVQRVERCLVLEGQEGGSAGETLSIAYAFLSTLFTRVEHQLPFVVDSPAGPIDLRVRTISELIPRLARQFVAFTISSERQTFITPLEAASPVPIQYITMFRKGPADMERTAMHHSDTVLTKDGVLVPGKEFFLPSILILWRPYMPFRLRKDVKPWFKGRRRTSRSISICTISAVWLGWPLERRGPVHLKRPRIWRRTFRANTALADGSSWRSC